MADEKVLAKQDPTYSQRFTSMVVREFGTQVGKLQLNPFQMRLAQNLFVAIDNQLKNLDAKRLDTSGGDKRTPIEWKNVNMDKLAVDSVHRVELGLDALIPNHIHPIPYFNKRLKKYDLDLRIGYAGKDCYRRKMAMEEPVDIVYELVYSNDEFRPIKKSAANPVESYEFNIKNSFDRGDVIGGFGYIVYQDPKKNKLVLVSRKEMDKSKAQGNDTFWKNHPEMMMIKTVVHRTTAKLPVDPEKVNASFLAVEQDDSFDVAAERVDDEIEERANGEVIDIEPEPEEPQATEPPEEPKATGTEGPDF